MSFLATLPFRPSVIALTETWLKDCEEKYLNLPNYGLISKPRNSSRGGGVGFYIYSCLEYSIRKFYDPQSEVLDVMSIEVKFSKRSNIIISCMYRPPASNSDLFNKEFDTFLCSVKPRKKNYVFAGDLNLNLLKLKQHAPTNDYYNTIVAQCLTPLITKPTRVTEFMATLIDNIFISTIMYQSKGTIFYDDVSDHFLILLEIANKYVPDAIDNSVKFRKYDLSSIDFFLHSMSNFDWDSLISRCATEADSNVLYNYYLHIFSINYEHAFPYQFTHCGRAHVQSPPWMTKILVKWCKKKC